MTHEEKTVRSENRKLNTDTRPCWHNQISNLTITTSTSQCDPLHMHTHHTYEHNQTCIETNSKIAHNKNTMRGPLSTLSLLTIQPRRTPLPPLKQRTPHFAKNTNLIQKKGEIYSRNFLFIL